MVTSSLGFNVATTSLSVKWVVLYSKSAVGSSVSIQSTEITFVPIFPSSSWNLNSTLLFSKKVIVLLPSAGFVASSISLDKIVIFGLSNVIVATTFSFVIFVVLNSTFAFGEVLSIQSTFAVAEPLCPLLSTNSKVNSPFSLNV